MVLKLEELAQKYFNLKLPITLEELKRRFRRMALKAHSDHGGDDELFIELKAAYDKLVAQESNPLVFSGAHGEVETTIEGIPLSELGLGLGPTINGADCSCCGRKGYTTTVIDECDDCLGLGSHIACSACHGSGKFRQERSGRIVNCRACGGSGNGEGSRTYNTWFFNAPRVDCRNCGGSGKITPRMRHFKCYNCNGAGEIRIYNPVIPKGRLMSK